MSVVGSVVGMDLGDRWGRLILGVVVFRGWRWILCVKIIPGKSMV